MKLGARILKTGMAIVLALFLAKLLNLPSPVFAAIAAIFAIQPSIYRSYLSVIEQIQGNIIGAAMAILFFQLFGNHFMIIGLAAIVVIIIHLQFKLENTITLSLVTLISIMVTPDEQFYSFAFIRFSTILLGILSAFFINLIFLPPKYEAKLIANIMNITSDIIKWIRVSYRQAADHVLLKNDIETIKERLIQLDQFYLFFKEERTFIKKYKLPKLRKLVIYRQMIATTKTSLNILKKLHHYENDLTLLPEHFLQKLMEYIDQLTTNHEHILLRYIGKAKFDHQEKMSEYECMQQQLLNLHINFLKEEKDEKTVYHTLQMIALLLDYNEHLEHLERLLNSLKTYHKEESEITFQESE